MKSVEYLMAKYPVSDHYDGSKFFNPTHPETPSLGDVVKMISTSRRKKWPNENKNEPRLKLSEHLEENQTAITFINHASLLLQTKTLNILTDPVYSKRVSPSQLVGPARAREPGLAFDLLPKIDVVVISHNHYDHLDMPTVKKLKEKFDPQFFISLGDKALLESHGITKVIELDWYASSVFKDTKFTFIPTQHFSGRGLFDRFSSLWGGWFMETPKTKILFGGDAGYSSHFKDIHSRLGAPDIALIPIGAYDPRWFMKPVHMNPDEAVQAHIDLQSKKSIGIHFGTFQLTEEGIDQPVIDLEIAKTAYQIADDSFIVLKEGQTEVF